MSDEIQAEDSSPVQELVKWFQHRMVDVGFHRTFEVLQDPAQLTPILKDMPDNLFEVLITYADSLNTILTTIFDEEERREKEGKPVDFPETIDG